MEEYKPKRFEFRSHAAGGAWPRSIGLDFARERYSVSEEESSFRDFYIHVNLWWWSMTIVLVRIVVRKL